MVKMERKLREIGGSLVITIPKQVADLYKFHDGDTFEFEPLGLNELRIRKIVKSEEKSSKSEDKSSKL